MTTRHNKDGETRIKKETLPFLDYKCDLRVESALIFS